MSNHSDRVVGSPSVRSAWHYARGRKIRFSDLKDDGGKVVGRKKIVSMNDGPGLKTWARLQMQEAAKKGASEQQVALGKLCSAWFAQKDSGRDDAARALRLKNKGQRIAAEKNATKAARHKKKGEGKKAEKPADSGGKRPSKMAGATSGD